MRNKILGIVATGLLLAACECAPDQNVNVGQAPAPGTAEDFKANIRDRVFLQYNRSDLTAESNKSLDAQAGWFKTYPNTTATVEGHCDARGTREYNLALGEKRAMTVRNYLIALGVESGRVQTISYGKERPAVTGSDEDSWAQNRRGVVVVQ